MWNYQSNDVGLISKGKEVKVSEFGGEGTGLKSMKQIKWEKNQRIQFVVEGQYNQILDGWTVQCHVVLDNKKHFMAKYERAGHQNMLNDFKYSVFAEDWHRSWGARGCQHKRLAEFFNPSFQYVEKSKKQTVLFSNARFTKDQNHRPMDTFCKDWTCASSRRDLVDLETGGSNLGSPQKFCPHNMQLRFQNNNHDNPDTGPRKFCFKKFN